LSAQALVNRADFELLSRDRGCEFAQLSNYTKEHMKIERRQEPGIDVANI
jgi:hypothetical protein